MRFLKENGSETVLLAYLKDNFGFEACESFDVELENVDSRIDELIRHLKIEIETNIVDC